MIYILILAGIAIIAAVAVWWLSNLILSEIPAERSDAGRVGGSFNPPDEPRA